MDQLILKQRKKLYQRLIKKLKKLFPETVTELDYSSPWELLVAVILSAQCTDDRVNKVTKQLFKKYPTLQSYADVDLRQLEKDIYSTGFYRAKARYLQSCASQLIKNHHGQVPQTLQELTQLSGVGRKTANVVLQNLYDIHEGIAVDTHVKRFAIRYGLSNYLDPHRIETDLMSIVPQSEWRSAGYYMKQYGRTYGPARNWNQDNDPLWILYIKK